MTYLRNCWYMAGWSYEIAVGAILARTLLGRPIALFRDGDGRVRAIADRCPHRFAPLSAGRLKGDRIVCGYHGLAFDGDGACVGNPHGRILQGLAVPAYPVTEAHRAAWIWMGDPKLADPARIPDLSYLGDAPDSAFNAGYLHAEANFELYIDNIMDLSHTDYLHPTTLGGAGITNTRAKVVETDDHVEVTWFTPNTVPSPLLVELFRDFPRETDFLQRVKWCAPGVIQLTAATVAAGGREEDAMVNLNAHVLTPETATTAHYFFGASRNYRRDDDGLNARIAEARESIFRTEDKPMIELIQQRMGDADFWSLKPALMTIDEAPVRVRRKLAAMIAGEARATKTPSGDALYGA